MTHLFRAVLCATILTAAYAAETAPEIGLAAKYPGDIGIDKDPDVLFAENFEAATIEEMSKRYSDVKRNENLKLSNDVPPDSAGKQSISMYHNHFYMHPKPVDQLYARYYQRWSAKTGYTHHLPFIIAEAEPTPWPNGFAGKRPDGAKFFAAAIDAWGAFGGRPAPGNFITYSYWHEMKPDGRGDYWGNNQAGNPDIAIDPGRWYCVEHMIKANTAPEARDGEHALWIDGVNIVHVKDRNWRTTNDLKINAFWLLHDNNTADLNHDTNPDRQYDMNFDDVVLATQYIGPIQKVAAAPAPTSKKPAAAPKAPSVAEQIDPKPHRDGVIGALQDPSSFMSGDVDMILLGRQQRCTVEAANVGGLRVSFDGNTIPLRWAAISDADLVTLAMAFCAKNAQAILDAGALAAAAKVDQGVQQDISDALWRLDPEKGKQLKELLRK